jgi:uncharacterized caspase-like protein
MFRLPIFAFAAGLLFCASACAEKHALVIGINAYQNVPHLQKAVGDALAMRNAFKAAGYRVVPLYDVSQEDFLRRWDAFLELVKEGDEAALFFSGHGLQIGAENYLLLKDVPMASGGESFVRVHAIQFSALLDGLQSKRPRVSLAILDACRDNPFKAQGIKAIGHSKGLIPVGSAPKGTFVMYSADKNEEALDSLSDDDHEPVSVYLRHLLPLLAKPGLRIQDVAIEVSEQVSSTALKVNHDQNPAYYDALRGSKFCFSGCSKEGALSPKQEPMTFLQTDECMAANPPISCLWSSRQ